MRLRKQVSVLFVFLLIVQLFCLNTFGFVTKALAGSVNHDIGFLGIDQQTQGHWQGKYGHDGYILEGYNGAPSMAYIPPKTDDLVGLPQYLSDYSYDIHGNLWYDQSYESNDNTVLDLPSGSDLGGKFNATAAGGGVKTYTFDLNDNQEHVFTFYSIVNNSADVNVTLEDLNGNVLDQRTFQGDSFGNGEYVSFMVSGSFKMVLGQGFMGFGPQGFFFDSPSSVVPNGVTVHAEPNRQAMMTWTNQGSPSSIVVERSTDGIHYTQVATLSGTSTSFVDTNLTPAQTYDYRLRYKTGTGYSVSTDPVTVTIPQYTQTILTLNSANISTTAGEQINLSASLQSINESVYADVYADVYTPLAGKTVTFTLQGPHVGDGQHMGQEIPSLMGTAVTGANGVAGMSYTCTYAGDYTVVASVPTDDVNHIDGANSAPIHLLVSDKQWNVPPVILRTSDAVKPGELFTINGYGMNAKGLEVAIAPSVDGSVTTAPPADAVQPQIVQTDSNGSFVVSKLPDNEPPGVYDVWVKNEFGWSANHKLNAARPSFISDFEISEGIGVELVGRNLDAREFGAKTATRVRLVDSGGSTYDTEVQQDVNPYDVTFKIRHMPLGQYWVEVSNDNGADWARLDNGQTLSVVAPGPDPLGLGVTWARDFNWKNVYDVSQYGVTPNSGSDVTAAVQNVVNQVKSAGGGIVYFPNGQYHVSQILLPADVILEGQDEYNTQLIYTGTSSNFIQSSGDGTTRGHQGVANLSLLLSNPNERPDSFMWLGENWGNNFNDESLRTASEIFIKRVNINYPLTYSANTGRGIGAEYIAKDRVLVSDNHFVGYKAEPYINAVSQYYTLDNNDIEYSSGDLTGLSTYEFYENNQIIGHPEDTHPGDDLHGLFGRNDSYMYHNTVDNMGTVGAQAQNDGEALCVEVPDADFNFGQVLAATPNDITVSPHTPLQTPTLDFGTLSVLITDGRGVGQYRPVTSISGFHITVSTPWTIVPDSTSKFTLIAPNDNVTFYDNTINNCAKGLWLFGNSIDGVVADNTSKNSEGIFIWTVRNDQGEAPAYFNRIVDNTVTGISSRSQHGGIGFNSGRFTDNGAYYGIMAYGTEMIGNAISGDPSATPISGATEAPPYGGLYASAASYSSEYDGNPSGGDGTNTLIEDNSLSNLSTGIHLTHNLYGTVVTGNQYDASVHQFINDTGSDNTLVSDNEQEK